MSYNSLLSFGDLIPLKLKCNVKKLFELVNTKNKHIDALREELKDVHKIAGELMEGLVKENKTLRRFLILATAVIVIQGVYLYTKIM